MRVKAPTHAVAPVSVGPRHPGRRRAVRAARWPIIALASLVLASATGLPLGSVDRLVPDSDDIAAPSGDV